MSSFLIIQTAFFGDVILATALVEQLAMDQPGCHIDMLVQKSREVLLLNNPHLRTVYTLDKQKKMRSAVSLIRTIRKNKYDRVLNVHRHGTSGILTWLSAAKSTIGFDTHPLSFLFHRTVKHQSKGVHEIERNFALASELVSLPICKPKLYPSKKDCATVKQETPYVTISPASVWETKKWPAERWVQLINHFPTTVEVFLLGGPGDRALCQEIELACNRAVINRAGEFSFLESAALMGDAVMNYTNDSAPVHMASAMNAPVTTMFLSTVPTFGYGPLSEDQLICESPHELSCRPCGIHGYQKCPKGHFKCADIEVSAVYSRSYADRL